MNELDFNNPEVILASSALIKPALAVEAARYVLPEDFEDRKLARVWAAVVGMVNDGLKEDAIDAVSVSKRFGSDPEIQRKIAMFCGDLLSAPCGKSLVTLAQRVRRRSTMRMVRVNLEQLQQELDEQIESNDGDIPNLDEKLASLSINVTTKLDITQRRSTYKNYTHEVAAYLDDVASFDSTTYVPTGIPKLDKKLGGGLRPGQLHVILGGTGSGKTALASQLCDSAVKHGHRAMLFSMEVDPLDIHIRDVERQASRSRWDLKNPSTKNQAIDDLIKAQAYLVSQSNSKVVFGEPISIEGIRQAVLTERVRGGPVRMIAVDHAQVAAPSSKDKLSMPRYLVVKGIAEGLRALARQLNVAVVLTAQLNPPIKAKDSDGKVREIEPSMNDVRESKDINNTAEVVLIIHHKREEINGESEIIESYIRVEKIRAGIGGKVKMRYRGEMFRWEELYTQEAFDAADSVAN
jgi:replicative DNA helicase